MGYKTGLLVAMFLAFTAGMITTVTVAFADEEISNIENPFGTLYNFLQDLKYGQNIDEKAIISTSDSISASVDTDLRIKVAELTYRINSLENPPKIHTTELLPVTGIDCSSRNMVEAFLSGWCPHPARNIYFIEDSRVNQDTIIAISLEQKFDDGIEEQSVCGVINQDVFNFSFHDDKTGKVTVLDDLNGFIMKCDQIPLNQDAILKYTIINS